MEEKQYCTTNLSATPVGADDFSDLIDEIGVKAQLQKLIRQVYSVKFI